MIFNIYPIQMYGNVNLTLPWKGQSLTYNQKWTNSVDLEYQILYTKMQPQSFLGSWEEKF